MMKQQFLVFGPLSAVLTGKKKNRGAGCRYMYMKGFMWSEDIAAPEGVGSRCRRHVMLPIATVPRLCVDNSYRLKVRIIYDCRNVCGHADRTIYSGNRFFCLRPSQRDYFRFCHLGSSRSLKVSFVLIPSNDLGDTSTTCLV